MRRSIVPFLLLSLTAAVWGQSPAISGGSPGGAAVRIKLLTRGRTRTATMENSETVRSFLNSMPLALDMVDLNGNEKYARVSEKFEADAPENPGIIRAGDIMLYAGNTIVVFYKTFSTSYRYVRLGRIDDTRDLPSLLGPGDLRVTFARDE